VADILLTTGEMDLLATYLNDEFDGIDLYPGDLDPDRLGKASAEVEALQRAGGAGHLSSDSALLAADVLAYFRDAFASDMQPAEAAELAATIAKLREVGAANTG
jgi:hypothetical protein